MLTKVCTRCHEEKELSLFVKSKPSKDGTRSHCKKCNGLYYAKRRVEQYDKVREYEKKNHRPRMLMSMYGLTLADYATLLSSQDNSCAICHAHSSTFTKNLAVDHCHTTGKIRGLLCPQCNKGLGLFKDSQQNLQKAIDYLKKYSHVN